MNYQIRPITAADNPAMARIIRDVMTEFGAVGPGYSIEDPEVDTMFETYQAPGHAFFVVDADGQIEGGAGIGTLPDAPDGVCELKKMYFRSSLRGLGAGDAMARQCFQAARELGYRQVYLETLDSMTAARKLYRKLGFADIDQAMGNTGHCGCNRWMLRDL